MYSCSFSRIYFLVNLVTSVGLGYGSGRRGVRSAHMLCTASLPMIIVITRECR